MSKNDYKFGGIERVEVLEQEVNDLDVFAVIDQIDQSEGSAPPAT